MVSFALAMFLLMFSMQNTTEEFMCLMLDILWDKGVNNAHSVGTAVDIQ